MNRSTQETLIVILVEKLGGEVIITDHDFIRADDLTLTQWDRPATRDYRLTAARPPEILTGEIVTAEPQSIEPPACPHKFDGLHWNFEGNLICGACGVTVGHDEQMVIRSIQPGRI